MTSARHILPCLLVLAGCLLFPTLHSRAQTSLPQPFAPWLEEMNKPSPSSAVLPAGPVLTPRDTAALMKGTTETAPSALETVYARRIVDELEQFGYDMFAGAGHNDKQNDKNDADRFYLPAGAVQDDFVLNIGDKLDITFRGQLDSRASYTITNQGLLIIEDLPPVSAAGRTIGQIRAILEAETATLHNTQVFVSLDRVRQINVLVVGHVGKPGRQTMTVFHTALDALMAAGGIEKTGSLRQIRLIRHGRSNVIDLYGLLIHGSTVTGMDLQLRDGDRIMVPPVGATVAVAGGVKRPGIYEILPGLRGMPHKPQKASRKLSMQEMLDLAGGILIPGQNRFMKLGLTEDGRETVEEIVTPYDPVFSDGSILMVAPSDEMRSGMVELTGHTRQPGLHAVDKAPSLSALIDSEKIFGPDIYPLIGVIERWNEGQMARELLSFSPLAVLKGAFDRKLQDGDVIHLFSRKQIIDLQQQDIEKTPPAQLPAGSAMGLPDDGMLHDPVLVSYLRERGVFVRGAIRQPGRWPVETGTSLENLLAVSGGLTLEANTANIEVTSSLQGEGLQTQGRSGTRRLKVNFKETNPETVMIGPGDTVRVNQKFRRVANNSVLIIGEVRHPGRYDLLPGDTMLKLLERAGGLTQQAYPDGAIFSRNSERKGEAARFRAQARDLELKLSVAVEEKDEPDTAQIAAVQELITQLKSAEAVGRITVEADPGILSVQPALDILLESGDRIYVPKRPLTVKVSGEVLSPANLQFRKDKDPRTYITEAGGFTFHADKDRAFVLYPDGSAQPLQVSLWNHSPVFIPPGSTLVVPRDPAPYSFLQTAKDVSQILSNLAITGIFLDDIRDD